MRVYIIRIPKYLYKVGFLLRFLCKEYGYNSMDGVDRYLLPISSKFLIETSGKPGRKIWG